MKRPRLSRSRLFQVTRRYGVGTTQRLIDAAMRNWVGAITRVQTAERVVALTFDDGPHPEYTPRLLEILESHAARGTFFMVGEVASRYPELVRRVGASGHVIGNHSWSHPSFSLITRKEQREQIRACEQAIVPHGQRLFRSPYGHQDFASCREVARLGYRIINWNIVAEDWREHDADWMADRMCNRITPGSIVALHDAIHRSVMPLPQQNREQMLGAVQMTLERLRKEFHFVTIPDLLRAGRPQRETCFLSPTRDMLPRLRELSQAAQASLTI